jgi:hypothetical protein
MQSQTPLPLTLEEHRELSREVCTAAERLHRLSNLVQAVYGPNNRAAFAFSKTVEALDHLRHELQTQALRDLPGFTMDDLYR